MGPLRKQQRILSQKAGDGCREELRSAMDLPENRNFSAEK